MPLIGCYCRVSTDDQDVDRQLEATAEYAERNWDAGVSALEVYRDKSTGTDTDRSGYRELMADAEDGEIDAVVVNSVSRICRSIQDLEKTAAQLEEQGVELHIVQEGLALKPGETDPYQKALFQLLGVFAELEAAITRQRVRDGINARMAAEDGYHHGRPPLGYDSDDGHLVPNEQYHDVVATIEEVAKGNLSKRKAAKRLDCGRKTITRALDRAEEMYGL